MHSSGPVRHHEEVVLNVYDLSPGWNPWLDPVGLGIYHSGIQVFGTEYTFGNDGVVNHTPKNVGDSGCPFKIGIVLGTVNVTRRNVEEIVYGLKNDHFVPGSYSLMQRNCNHFAEALAKALLGQSIPGWVNRIASIGVCCSCFLPREALEDPMTGHSRVNVATSKRFRGSGHALGSGIAMTQTSTDRNRSGNGPGSEESREQRRQRMAAAAEARRKAARAKRDSKT